MNNSDYLKELAARGDGSLQAWFDAEHADGRTCGYAPMWDEDDPIAEERLGTWATDCGEALTWNAENDGCGEPPAFCPYCGGAVKEVD